jgi:hypothetical protein
MPDKSDFELVVDAIHEALGDTTIEYACFRTGGETLLSPRRVAWIPTIFGCERVTRSGTNAAFTDRLTVECHIAAETFAEACHVRKQVCTAVHKVFRGNTATDGTYPAESTSKQKLEWEGPGWIVQRFVWELDVERQEETYPVRVRQIDLVDRADLTTTVDGVLTPDESASITEAED